MKPKLLLLHGALGSAEQMQPLCELLSNDFEVFSFDLPGHGCAYQPDHVYDMAELKEALKNFLDAHFQEPIMVFGYSMGGYLAAALAAESSTYFESLVCLGTKWQWNPENAQREVAMLNPDAIEEKVPALARILGERHGTANWKNVVKGTANMLQKLGDEPLLSQDEFKKITCRTHILRGDQDRMISREESEWAQKYIVKASYEELPGQKHPMEQVDLYLLKEVLIKKLLNK